MLKTLKLRKEKEIRSQTLEELESKLEELIARKSELEKAIEESETQEDLDLVDEQVQILTKEEEDLEKEKEMLVEEIDEIENQLKELMAKAEKLDEEKRGEEKLKNVNEKELEVRGQIVDYVKSRKLPASQERAFKVVDGGALIPEEVLNAEIPESNSPDLRQFVNVRSVSTISGKLPVMEHSGKRMHTVAELEKNPKLANPKFNKVPWSVETYRGYIPVSQEAIDDGENVVAIIASEINDQTLNTTNAEILEAVKTINPTEVSDVDELKGLLNTGLKKKYNPVIFMSASMFNEVDALKDDNGRYLFQQDMTAQSGMRLFGYRVVILDDDLIGEKDGEKVAFVGDLKRAVTYFDRKQASVKWIDHMVYGQMLASFIRFDVAVTDENAGYYVTFGTPTP